MDVDTMRSRIVFAITVILAFDGAMQSMVSAKILTPANSGFEAPVVPDDALNHIFWRPTIADQGGAGWTFGWTDGGAIGITRFDGALAPSGSVLDGTQALFFLVKQNWSMHCEQAISGFNAGPATVRFSAGARDGVAGASIKVFIDETPLTFAGVDHFTPVSGTWSDYTSDPINVTAGTHTLKLANVVHPEAGGDFATAIDAVSINSMPAPSGVVLLDRNKLKDKVK
jgi:hypothetical protein